MRGAIPHDIFEPTLAPLLHLKPLCKLRDGIFTPLERAQNAKRGLISVLTERGTSQAQALTQLDDLAQAIEWDFSKSIGMRMKPAMLLEKIGENIASDFATLEGTKDNMRVNNTAKISPQAVLDATNGPIVIEAGVRIGAFSIVQGPAYIGANTQLDRCSFSNSIAGTECRLGGEIADSIIGNYSNKHHEGFLGHSLVGDWVNLGALTTTSDLKNNYGEVRLTYREEFFATDSIKFGAIIGDYVKTAIGTLLSTGTVIDLGSSIFGEPNRSGYIKPFTWGKNLSYEPEKFLTDAGRMMARREKAVSPALEQLLALVR